MTYSQYKSLKEDMPIENYGLILKIIPDEASNHFGRDSVEDASYLYYGYRVGTYIFAKACIKDNELLNMCWKMHKEYDNHEIFWLYNQTISTNWKDISEESASAISHYGKFIKIIEKD